MMKYYCYFYFYLLSCCLISNILFAQNQTYKEAEDLIQQSKTFFQSNPTLSHTYAKKAESLISKMDDLSLEAEIYMILGDIYGLKQSRSDKAAEYHRKAFEIYRQLFKSKKINCQFLYNFFLDHITPIYELISDENYHRHRRDKLAIRKYQMLYTELSQFFLENDVKKSSNVVAKLVQNSQKEYIQVKNPIAEGIEKHIE